MCSSSKDVISIVTITITIKTTTNTTLIFTCAAWPCNR